VPAARRFVSYEPALGPVSFAPWLRAGLLDWVISGGESGDKSRYKPRPAVSAWFRFVLDECRAYDVPYFHKQNGGTTKIDGTWGGKLLDGETHNAHPLPMPELVPIWEQAVMF